MGRVVHFEIHADDTARALKFYADVFGWKFIKWDGPVEYFLITTGSNDEPGINGGLMKRMGAGPVKDQSVNSYVCTVDVKSVDDSAKTVESKGGKVVVPKMAIQGVGWLLYCIDTEGNVFGMMQEDANAK